jgi:hypothetical protein
LDTVDRSIAQDDDAQTQAQGRSAITTTSFLVCRYGGLIEPYNSGQGYESDAQEMQYAQEDEEMREVVYAQ